VRTFAAVQNTTGHAESIEYDLRYTPGGASDSQCQAVTIDADGGFESIPVPEEIYGVAEYQIPVTDKLIVQIDHWAALWAANIAAILYQGALLKKKPPLKLLWLAAKALSSNKWMVLSKANQVGRGCDIHPTAYIEGSIIGENVRVGAGTVIREAIIGSGTYIGNNNSIEVSVIGERCVVWSGSAIQFSVVNPGSNIGCRFLSASLVGRGSLLADGVTLTDVRLDGQNITVLKDGLAVDTENRVLGCCVGHRAYLGSGVVLAPGRIVPNGMRIASGEERVLASIKPGTVPKGYRLVPGNDRQ
jgi:ADP-glucose pyrophosphorylase